jgi:hypothetical protein
MGSMSLSAELCFLASKPSRKFLKSKQSVSNEQLPTYFYKFTCNQRIAIEGRFQIVVTMEASTKTPQFRELVGYITSKSNVNGGHQYLEIHQRVASQHWVECTFATRCISFPSPIL